MPLRNYIVLRGTIAPMGPSIPHSFHVPKDRTIISPSAHQMFFAFLHLQDILPPVLEILVSLARVLLATTVPPVPLVVPRHVETTFAKLGENAVLGSNAWKVRGMPLLVQEASIALMAVLSQGLVVLGTTALRAPLLNFPLMLLTMQAKLWRIYAQWELIVLRGPLSRFRVVLDILHRRKATPMPLHVSRALPAIFVPFQQQASLFSVLMDIIALSGHHTTLCYAMKGLCVQLEVQHPVLVQLDHTSP